MTYEDQLAGERQAIIAVIEEETAAWLRGDLAAWKACWVEGAHAMHANARPSVGARILHGIDAIHRTFTPYIEANRDRTAPPPKVRREAWRVNIGQDMAWATFDQLIPVGTGEDKAPGRHNQLRILEKVDGRWKIAAVFQIPNRIGYYKSPWVRVDRTGTIIEMSPGAEAALAGHPALQRVGQRLCVRQSQDRDKLSGALDDAYGLINQRSGRPPEALILSHPEDTAISLVWVSNADMMIVVLLGDEGLLTSAMDHAARVFGLSPTQTRVAEEIARGRDLTEVAVALGVQPNTVRTHVRRMFDRLEVNSQPALIRALLSVRPPSP